MKRVFLILVLLFGLLMPIENTLGLVTAQFVHTPPEPKVGMEMELFFLYPGAKRARVLIAQDGGYITVEMKKTGDRFYSPVRFENLAVIKYQFQIELIDRTVHETGYYSIRQPTTSDLESSIAALKAEYNVLQGRQVQLQNTLQSLKNTDPVIMARKKNQELAKAYLTLTRKERERDQLLKQSKVKGVK